MEKLTKGPQIQDFYIDWLTYCPSINYLCNLPKGDAWTKPC